MSMDYLEKASDIEADLIEWRRHLHQYPETAFEEYDTAEFIKKHLESFGLNVTSHVAKTGLTATIYGKHDGPTIAIRADMDALPIQDEKDVEYRSKVAGAAHLCGHDAHTTMLMGVGKILSEYPPEYGNVKLIFQPAEEKFGGAKYMIKEGVLENPTVDAIVALHVCSKTEVGNITVADGIAHACTDGFTITIEGKGGHAAHPHLSTDAITIASTFVTTVQQIISRELNPLEPIVITVGEFHGGSNPNAIAQKVTLSGTVRLLNPDLRKPVQKIIERYLDGIVGGMGGTFEFNYREGYPPVKNNHDMVKRLDGVANRVLGEDRLIYRNPSMGGEDFAYYTFEVPALMFRLGIRNESRGIMVPGHHPEFDIDESAMKYGVAVFLEYANQYLREQSGVVKVK